MILRCDVMGGLGCWPASVREKAFGMFLCGQHCRLSQNNLRSCECCFDMYLVVEFYMVFLEPAKLTPVEETTTVFEKVPSAIT